MGRRARTAPAKRRGRARAQATGRDVRGARSAPRESTPSAWSARSPAAAAARRPRSGCCGSSAPTATSCARCAGSCASSRTKGGSSASRAAGACRAPTACSRRSCSRAVARATTSAASTGSTTRATREPGDRVLIAPLAGGRAELLQVVARRARPLGRHPARARASCSGSRRIATKATGGCASRAATRAVRAIGERRARRSRAVAASGSRERRARSASAKASRGRAWWSGSAGPAIPTRISRRSSGATGCPSSFPPEALAQAEALRAPDARELAAAHRSARPRVRDDRSRDRARPRRRGVRRDRARRIPALGGDRGRVALGRAGLADRSRGAPARQQRVLPRSRDPDAARAPVGRRVLAAPGRRSARAGRRDGVRRARRARPHALLPRGDPQPRAPDLRAGRGRDRAATTTRSREAPMLRDLARLAPAGSRERRRAAGSLDFELPSPAFVLDERGCPIDVRPAPRNEAHRAIEEAMLAANRAVAEWLVEREIEAVHRVHEPPAPPDLERLTTELAALGLRRRRRCGRALGARARARARARGGQPRRALDPPARAAQHEARALQRARDPALRARLRALPALHLADPALPRPRGAPRAQGRARGRGARAHARARRVDRGAQLVPRARGDAGRARDEPDQGLRVRCAITSASGTRAP